MLIDDIVMHGEQSVWYDANREKKRVTCQPLNRKALSTSRRAQVAGEQKKETAFSLG